MDQSDPLDFDKETIASLTSHERRAREEVLDWRSTDNGPMSSARKTIEEAAGSLFSRVTPGEVRRALKVVLEGSTEVMQDGSRFTYRTESILKKARALNIEAEKVADLGEAQMEDVDDLSKKYVTSNKVMAATEYFGK